jgi:hypothetical protein
MRHRRTFQRAPRRLQYRICTGVAPEAVVTMRTHA